MAQSSLSETALLQRLTATVVSAAICVSFFLALSWSQGSSVMQPRARQPHVWIQIVPGKKPSEEEAPTATRDPTHPAVPLARAATRSAPGSRHAELSQLADPVTELRAPPGPVGQEATSAVPPARGTSPPRLAVDISMASIGTRSMVQSLADTSGAQLQLGAKTQGQRLAEAIATSEKRDCLGPRPDLIQLAIYLKTVASGKCKGQ